MTGPLFARNMKKGIRLMLPFLAIIFMYQLSVIYLFDPELADTLKAYQEAMPQMMSAFGMVGATGDMLSFVYVYLYGFIFFLVPLIYTMMLVNTILARDIDTGAIAQILAMPLRRTTIIRTHILSIFVLLTLFLTSTTLFGWYASEWFFLGEMDLKGYALLNVATLLLHLALAGLCLFAACLSSTARTYWSIGAGLPLLFYLFHMLASMGEQLEVLRYASIFSLFPGDAIAYTQDATEIILKLSGLGGIALLLALLGAIIFTRRSFSV